MLSKDDNPEVQKQYKEWVYPEPIADLEEHVVNGGRPILDPNEHYHLLWPGRRKKKLSILVAGCGTTQAAMIAYKSPDHEIVAIDISETSIEHTKRLKAKHNLENLTVRYMSLFDVKKLEQTFDLIFSTGVLHHLPEPVKGARALKGALSRDGVMHLMLYGKTLRAGVYMLQEAFRAMGLKQSQEDVDQVKAMLEFLPEKHAIHKYGIDGKDFKYDAGIVDTLLHPQDTAFSVKEIYEFAEKSGLKFRGWLDRGMYCPENYFNAKFPGMETLKAMSEKEQAIFLDNFMQRTGTHRFNLCHKEVDESSYEMDFEGDQWQEYVPILRKPFVVMEKPNWPSGKPPVLRRGPYKFGITKPGAFFLEACTAERTIRECIAYVEERILNPVQPPETMARKFFRQMWKKGHIFFKIPPAS